MKQRQSGPKTSQRKPYRKPELTEFGRVKELTRANAPTGGMGDGGGPGMTKT